ncbi:hypothetical protein BGX27_004301 [Mortierella sp. AM989]|nr:hypothetical protein BGX27_004301 [Mortierella sp. AM989]
MGVVFGGVLAQQFGLRFVFVQVVPTLALLNFIYVCHIPESMKATDISNNLAQHNQPSLVQFQQPQESSDSKTLKQTWNKTLQSCDNQVKAISKGFIPDMVPNRLPGKYSFVIITLTMFIANAANLLPRNLRRT